MLTAIPTSIPPVWVKQAQDQRAQIDQCLIAMLDQLCPSLEMISTFGVEDSRHGVVQKAIGRDDIGFIVGVAEVGSARTPSREDKQIFLELEWNALNKVSCLLEVNEFKKQDGIWGAL